MTHVTRRSLVATLLLAVLYVAVAKLSFALAFVNTSIAPVWLPSGLAVAAVVRFGYRAVPGVWLGAFAFNASTAVPLWLAMLFSLGNTAEAVCAAGLLRRVGFRPAVDRIRDVLALAGLGAVVAAAVSATCGVAGLLLGGLVTPAGAGSAWLLWWSGDGIGVFTLTPVLLLLGSAPRAIAWPAWRRVVEAAAIGVVLTVAVAIGLQGGPVRPFLVFPVLVWAAIRFRRGGANVTSLLISAVIVYVSIRRVGPFAGTSAVDTLLATQSFIAVVMITSLLLAAMTIERERITGELQSERAQLREAQRIARLGSWEWDVTDDVVRCSDELRDIYGLADPSRLTFRALIGQIHPDDRARVESGVAAALADHAPFAVEHRIVRPDGQVRTLHFRGEPRHDGRGAGTRVFGTGLDVTELRAVQDALRDQQAHMQAIIDAAGDAFVSIDEHGAITGWNRSAETLFGWSATEVTGRSLVSTIVPPAARDAHSAGLRRVVGGGRGHLLGQRLDVTGLCRDGREVPVELTIGRVRARRGTQFHAFIRDITERQRVEQTLADARDEALAASRLKSSFFAMMSHELKTPLSAILGLTNQSVRAGLAPEHRTRLQTINDAGQTLLQAVNEILDYSRLESGQVTLNAADFDLDAVLPDAVAAVQAPAHDKGLAVAWSRDPGVPARCHGDPVRLRQLLTNLAVNAVRCTDHGGVAIHASLAPPGDPGASGLTSVQIDVTDTGVGFAEHQLAALFEPFAQLDSSAYPLGVGLGLAISRRLAELMGGQLTASSKAGSGSTFSCTIPLGSAGETEGVDPVAVETATHDPDGARLLLVEDDVVSRAVALDLLTGCGYEVDQASNGMQAVTMAARTRYAAILMDCRMPLMDGYAATASVRRQEPSDARVPIIALTASDVAEDRDRCLAAGMDDFVAKPIDFDELIGKLARWIRPAEQVRTGVARHR
jgi:PAS domain S-box-containing protein